MDYTQNYCRCSDNFVGTFSLWQIIFGCFVCYSTHASKQTILE